MNLQNALFVQSVAPLLTMVYDAMPDEIVLVAASIDEEVGIFSSGAVGRATYFRWR